MELPSGFDPSTGTFTNISKPKIQSNYNTKITSSYSRNPAYDIYSSYNYKKSSIWDRINDTIKSVGNWIDDIIEPVSGWISLIAILIGIICLAIWVFSDFNILYIIFRLIGACIIGYISMIGLGFALLGIELVMKAIRFIFWNVWTLLIALIIAIGCLVYTTHGSTSYNNASKVQTVIHKHEIYRCTATVLNVRSMPTQNSRVIGTLRKGQEVEVIKIEKDFATIMYNGQKGYVSLKYLNKIND